MKNKKASELKEVELNGHEAHDALEKFGSYTFQRKIKPGVVKEYAKRMIDGDFLGDSTLVFAVDKQAKQTILIDGYNRLSALATLGSDFSLEFLMRYYVCESTSEVDKLYEACDSVARTKEDYVAVKAKRIGLDLTRLALSWTVNYVSMFKKKTFHLPQGDNAEKAKLLEGNEHIAKFIDSIRVEHLEKKDNRPFKNGNIVLCIAFAFEVMGETLAREFFGDVLSLGDVRPDGVPIVYLSPARTFRRSITKAYHEGAKGWWGATSEKRMTVAIMFQNAVKAWLAGKNLEIIKHSNSVFDWDGVEIKKLAAKRNK